MGQDILLLHGFASSSGSSKAAYLAEKLRLHPEARFRAVEFNPTPQDFEFMTVTGLINRLRQFLLDHPPSSLRLIGSSLGALTGIHYADRFGGVERLLLLAPALAFRGMGLTEEEVAHWREHGTRTFMHYALEAEIPLRFAYYRDGLEYQRVVRPPCPMRIIHGRQDEIVPIEHSRQYAARFPDLVELIEVDSGHRLADQMALIWAQVESFLVA
jgi:pimeloyl-ACP methyl ester carboxylesterase